jgi:hypothetical protein
MLIPDRNGVAGRHVLRSARMRAATMSSVSVVLTSGPQARVKPIPAPGVPYLSIARLDVRKHQRLSPQLP